MDSTSSARIKIILRNITSSGKWPTDPINSMRLFMSRNSILIGSRRKFKMNRRGISTWRKSRGGNCNLWTEIKKSPNRSALPSKSEKKLTKSCTNRKLTLSGKSNFVIIQSLWNRKGRVCWKWARTYRQHLPEERRPCRKGWKSVHFSIRKIFVTSRCTSRKWKSLMNRLCLIKFCKSPTRTVMTWKSPVVTWTSLRKLSLSYPNIKVTHCINQTEQKRTTCKSSVHLPKPTVSTKAALLRNTFRTFTDVFKLSCSKDTTSTASSQFLSTTKTVITISNLRRMDVPFQRSMDQGVRKLLPDSARQFKLQLEVTKGRYWNAVVRLFDLPEVWKTFGRWVLKYEGRLSSGQFGTALKRPWD